MQAQEFIEKHNVIISGTLTTYDDPFYKYDVDIMAYGQTVTVPFMHGNALTFDEKSVLECVSYDLLLVDDLATFENFCYELGYDEDSRRAYSTWQEGKAQLERIKEWASNTQNSEIWDDIKTLSADEEWED